MKFEVFMTENQLYMAQLIIVNEEFTCFHSDPAMAVSNLFCQNWDLIMEQLDYESREERKKRTKAEERAKTNEDAREQVLRSHPKSLVERHKEIAEKITFLTDDFREGDAIFLSYAYHYGSPSFVLWSGNGTTQQLMNAIDHFMQNNSIIAYGEVVILPKYDFENLPFHAVTMAGRDYAWRRAREFLGGHS